MVDIAAGVSHGLALTTDPPIYAVPIAGIEPVPRLKLLASIGPEYEIQHRDAMGSTNDWLWLDTVTLGGNPEIYYDESASGQSQRFYRMVSTNNVSAMEAAIVPRLTLEAEVGVNYRLEYRNAFSQSTNWLSLDHVNITNNPQFYYDESAIGRPPRVYQLFETNAP